MYGEEPSLYIGGQDYYGTFFGLITTIISLISYFICSVYFILEMLDTSNVSSFTSVQNPSTPLSINFTSNKFYFTFSLQDPKTYDTILDESIYTVKAEYKIATRNNNGTIQWENSPIEIEPCQLSKFNKKYQSLFEKRNLENSILC